MYSETLIDHFNSPRNVGEIKDTKAQGQAYCQACGDITFFYLDVQDERIRAAKAKSFGCAAAIASASMLTTMLPGKSLAEAGQISSDEIVENLGGLPEAKRHCVDLAVNALHKAIEHYGTESES